MTTAFNADAIAAAASNLGSIMDDMSAFDALKANLPDTGQFAVATWLQQLVADRIGGIISHAENLKVALQDIETTLQTIATNFTSADGDNAAKISSSISDMEQHIGSDVSAQEQTSTVPPGPVLYQDPSTKT